MKGMESTAKLLVNAEFRLRSMEEARLLARYISTACPIPNMAELGLTELLINAIEHGNLEIGYQEKTILQQENRWIAEIEKRLAMPKNQDKYVTLTYTLEQQQISISISDCGPGFQWQNFEKQNNTSTHGRGILVAKSMSFDAMQYNKAGNKVSCVIFLPSA